MTSPALTKLLRETGPILLDFDGPVCDIFANGVNSALADDLRAILRGHSVAMPATIAHDFDPLNVLRFAASRADDELTEELENTLVLGEVRSALTVGPTPHALQAISECHRAGRPVVMVSNNSAAAIQAFLDRHELSDQVRAIIGRAHAAPHLMKPDHHPVRRALAIVDSPPEACTLIGDSVSDVEVAKLTGVHPVGFAKTRRRGDELADAGAQVIIDSMLSLVEAVRATHSLPS